MIPPILWHANFLKAEGMDPSLILFQDNIISMFLEKNGQASSSKPTCHIILCYFYIKDHVDNSDIVIEYCPTEEMIA